MRQAPGADRRRGVEVFPTLSVGGSNQNLGLVANWELDLWGRIRRTRRSAAPRPPKPAPTSSRRRNSRCRRSSRRTTSCCACRTRKSACCRTASRATRRSLQLTRNQYAVGVVSRGDVVQAEAQLNVDPGPGARRRGDAGAARARHRRADRQGAGRIRIAAAPLNASIPGGAAGAAVRAAGTAPGHRRGGAQDGGGQRADRRRARRRSIRRSASSPAAASEPRLRGRRGARPGPVRRRLRDAQSAQATAAYDETVADYRQTMLAAFRDVEDNLAALRILEEKPPCRRRR